MIEDISQRLLGNFADCLQKSLAGSDDGDAGAGAGAGAGRRRMRARLRLGLAGRQRAARRRRAPRRTAPMCRRGRRHALAGGSRGPDPAGPAPVEAAEPVEGLSLLASVLWGRVKRSPAAAAGVVGFSCLRSRCCAPEIGGGGRAGAARATNAARTIWAPGVSGDLDASDASDASGDRQLATKPSGSACDSALRALSSPNARQTSAVSCDLFAFRALSSPCATKLRGELRFAAFCRSGQPAEVRKRGNLERQSDFPVSCAEQPKWRENRLRSAAISTFCMAARAVAAERCTAPRNRGLTGPEPRPTAPCLPAPGRLLEARRR